MLRNIGNKLISFFYDYYLIIFLVLYCLHLVGLDRIPIVLIDEPWFGVTVHNLIHKQLFINDVFNAYGGCNYFLLPIVTFIPVVIFGMSLFSLRLTLFLVGLFSIIIWDKLLKELKFNRSLRIFGCILFLSCNSFLFFLDGIVQKVWLSYY